MSDENIIYFVAGKKEERHTGQKWVPKIFVEIFFFVLYLIGK